jgi:hypothetical protein
MARGDLMLYISIPICHYEVMMSHSANQLPLTQPHP